MTACDLFEREGLSQLERGIGLDPHFDSCPDCLEARRVHDHLGREIADLDSRIEPSPAWKARVWASIEEQRASGTALRRVHPAPALPASRQWIPWLAPRALAPLHDRFAVLSAVAALAVIVVWISRPLGVPAGISMSLTAEVYGGQTAVRRGEDAHRGNELRVRAPIASHSHAELRVYFNDSELTADCSAETSCAREGDVISITTVMRSLGTYRPVLIVSNKAIPAPVGNLDQDAAAALRAGALVQAGDPIPVR